MADRPILITGSAGMLGRAVVSRVANGIAADHARLDIADELQVAGVLDQVQPSAVINCAAFTAVDRCESEPAIAWRANADGPTTLAQACARRGIRLIHISTDYVFAGDLDRPYHEEDVTGPRTIYGASKLAGELAVRERCPNHLILRTAWLYGPGGPSFVHTMLRLGTQVGPPLTVVADQIGNPTSTTALAELVASVVDSPVIGTMHASCEGETSWHGFAAAIFARRPMARSLLPCTTADYPRPAPRPANSRLDKRALRRHGLMPLPDWRDALDRFLSEHLHG